MSKKYLFLGLLILAFLIAPLATRALTTAEQIAQLQQQILFLQAQLRQLQSQSPNPWCHTFNISLGVGTNNQEAGFLIQALAKEGLLDYNQTVQPGTAGTSLKATYFSESVAAAVSSFQLKYAGEILTPLGLTTPTGYVGHSTRRVLNRLYGCGIVRPIPVGNQPPVISGVSGPTSLNVGQTATWTVQASDPDSPAGEGPLWYSVIWGDELAGVTPNSRAINPPDTIQQTATFTHIYYYPSTYTPTFRVVDDKGLGTQASLSVVVGQNQNYSLITVTSPNGGEQWLTGSTKTISWRYDGATSATKVDLWLYRNTVCPPGMACMALVTQPIVLDRNISALATYNWIVGTDIVNNPIASGNYHVSVCPTGIESPWNSNCDSSDDYFTIDYFTILSPII